MRVAAGMPSRCGLPAALLVVLASAPCARAAHGPRALEASILGGEEVGSEHSFDNIDEAPDDDEMFVEEDHHKRRHHSHHAVVVRGKGQLVQGIVQESPSSRKTAAGSAVNASTGSALVGGESSQNVSPVYYDSVPVVNDKEVTGVELKDVIDWETKTAKRLTWREFLWQVAKLMLFWTVQAVIVFMVVYYINSTKHRATQGCATILCSIIFFPCGLFACCVPMDEETPTMPILAPTTTGTQAVMAGGEAAEAGMKAQPASDDLAADKSTAAASAAPDAASAAPVASNAAQGNAAEGNAAEGNMVPSAAPSPQPPTFQGSAEPDIAPPPPPPPVDGGPPPSPDVAPPEGK